MAGGAATNVVQWKMWRLVTTKRIRDFVGITLGAAILSHETFMVPTAEPLLLATGLGCIAGTYALKADEKARAARREENE